MQIEVVGVRFRHGITTYSFSPNGGKYKKGDLKVAKGKSSSAAVKKTTATKAVKDGVKKTADTAVNTASKVVPVGVVIKLSGSVLNMAKKSVASK